MPQSLTTINELQDYLIGVSERSGHHAQNVSRVIFTLAGGYFGRSEPGIPV